MWRAFFCAGILLSIEWIVVYGGANWITDLHHHRITLRTRIDCAIPFVPTAAIIYLSLFPMLWLAPFILRTPAELRGFAQSLATIILFAGIGFLLVPVDTIDVPSAGLDVVGRVFHFADVINLKHNYFPSLHVAMAVVCAISFSRPSPPAAKIFYWLWAAAIALSTLLTHQHYIADVIVGGILGALIIRRQLTNQWFNQGCPAESATS